MNVNNYLNGKCVTITGGTGSFGTAMLHRLLKTEVSEIRIISRDEKKQEDLRLRTFDSRVKFIICDVRDLVALRSALQGSDVLFHAAAMKQVPTCEFNPTEAVKTNILGPLNVVECMKEIGNIDAVFLSTDKAVYPINAMGISKAMMEKIVLSQARHDHLNTTRFMCTRYGNVMASRGSVIPLFVKQMLTNSPVTITDPSMTRFLMTLEESADLVVHAFEHGVTGDTFVLKSPSCTVETLVNSIAQVLGVDPIKKIIGVRHGEKNYETLIGREEMSRAIEGERYFRIPIADGSMNYHNSDIDPKLFSNTNEYNSSNTQILVIEDVVQKIRPIVEHISNNLSLY
jgi:UDP-N-acetylglucosamine 4,6-dehydratase/5-epimerase